MKILVVDDHALIREALCGVLKEVKGDAAVLEASDCRQAMQSALQLVFAGGIYIPPEILVCEDLPLPKPALTRLAADTARVTPGDLGLTGRQLDVLALMMQGKSNKAI